MNSTRYVVTGGAGFIGSHIAEALVKRGETVRVFDNLTTGKTANIAHLGDQIQMIQGDLRDFEAVSAAIAGAEVVFHQGALPSVPRSIVDPVGSLETNINGTHNVLLAARNAGVRRVVYASSSSVYGNTAVLPKHEAMLPAPMSPYAAHKLTGEYLCSVFTRVYGVETVALRYFNVFGPRQDPSSEYAAVIPRFISALVAGNRPVIFGDGEQTRDFTYVANVVEANLRAADVSNAAGLALNIGCGRRVTLNEVLRTLAELLKVDVNPVYQEARAGDVRDSLADITLAGRVLAYAPTVDFRQGLMQTVESLHVAVV